MQKRRSVFTKRRSFEIVPDLCLDKLVKTIGPNPTGAGNSPPAPDIRVYSAEIHLLHSYKNYESLSNYIFSGTSIPIVAKAAVKARRLVSATATSTAFLVSSGSEMILWFR